MITTATSIVTGPATRAVADRDAEYHLRATGQEPEQYLPYLAAAQAHVEMILDRKLIQQTWRCFLDWFPAGDEIRIPFGKLVSVTHLKYTDSAGTQTTFAASNYHVVTNRDPGRIVLAYQATWPTVTLRSVDAIEIEFVCGWANQAAVPDDIRNAILLMAGHLAQNREAVLIPERAGIESIALKLGIDSLLDNWRIRG